MKPIAAVVLAAALGAASPALAQPPRDPALLVPQEAPPLAYRPVEPAVTLPEGMEMGASAAVAFDARGHLFVLTRGEPALWEFDPDGRFVRAFGEGLFRRSHGLHVDPEGNLWVADVGAHVVLKLDREGRVLMTLGTPGEAGTWDEASGSRRFNEPNDIAVARNGDVFVVQGHMPGERGDPRVLKFDRGGTLLASWGGKGTGPGQFQVAHGVAIDARGDLWVMDRENSRIQVFDTSGTYRREMRYAGLPCGVDIGADAVFMVNGFTGQIVKLALDGAVLGALGTPGRAPGEFGEAHYIAVSPKGELFVADTVNRALQKFVPAS
jgi:DNA-binding beta-propeller fold protein YncE